MKRHVYDKVFGIYELLKLMPTQFAEILKFDVQCYFQTSNNVLITYNEVGFSQN